MPMTLHNEQDAIKQVGREKNCQECGKTYSRNPKYSSQQWLESKFCSRECLHLGEDRSNAGGWNKGLKTAEPKKCDACSVVSLRVAFYSEHKMYLCQKHYWHLRNHGRVLWGDDRPLITPEITRLRRSKQYGEWRTQVFKRDDYTCQFCGVLGVQIQADHIKEFAHFPELRFELSNGRTLCVPCHKKTPSYLKPHYQPI